MLTIISILVAALIGCGVCIASLLDQRKSLIQFVQTMSRHRWSGEELLNIVKGLCK